jgi:hypothetical protein
MDKENKSKEDASENRDDFETITGIGASIAEALYQSGIHRFSELSQFTPEKLANLLGAKVAFVSVQRIENDDWLGQARKLASKKEKHVPEANWREMADFFVSFGEVIDSDGNPKLKTKVHYSQKDITECWDGIAVDKLTQWMLTHVDLPKVPESVDIKSEWKDQLPIQADELEEQVDLEVSNLWVSQVTVPVHDEPNTSKNMVRVEGALNFSGPDALSLTYERVPFAIEIYLVNKENNQPDLAATYSCQTEPHELQYEFQQDLAIPARGKYRICMKARLLHPFMAEIQKQGPILKVGKV